MQSGPQCAVKPESTPSRVALRAVLSGHQWQWSNAHSASPPEPTKGHSVPLVIVTGMLRLVVQEIWSSYRGGIFNSDQSSVSVRAKHSFLLLLLWFLYPKLILANRHFLSKRFDTVYEPSRLYIRLALSKFWHSRCCTFAVSERILHTCGIVHAHVQAFFS